MYSYFLIDCCFNWCHSIKSSTRNIGEVLLWSMLLGWPPGIVGILISVLGLEGKIIWKCGVKYYAPIQNVTKTSYSKYWFLVISEHFGIISTEEYLAIIAFKVQKLTSLPSTGKTPYATLLRLKHRGFCLLTADLACECFSVYLLWVMYKLDTCHCWVCLQFENRTIQFKLQTNICPTVLCLYSNCLSQKYTGRQQVHCLDTTFPSEFHWTFAVATYLTRGLKTKVRTQTLLY